MSDPRSRNRFQIPKLPFKLDATVVLVGVSALIIVGEMLLGSGGCVEIEPGEAAVVYNNTGLALFGDDARTIVEQGAKTFLPGLQSIEKLERRPQVFVMANDAVEAGSRMKYDRRTVNVSKALTVRANDGSNFYFDRLEVHYQIVAAEASKVIETSGPGDAYKHHILATHTREILRDEFGRYSFLEIANPTTYGAATTEAKTHLNERLKAYGVEVTQIVTPKPKFEERVEKAIEDRQGAEQEVEVQEEKRRRLEQEEGLKIQSIEQEKNGEYQSLIAELEAQKKAASNGLISVKREADKHFIEQQSAGTSYKAEKLTRAKANEVAYRKEAEGLVAKITAVGAQGPDVLNRAIAEFVFPQLEKITATPLIKASTPIDIRHIDADGGAR